MINCIGEKFACKYIDTLQQEKDVSWKNTSKCFRNFNKECFLIKREISNGISFDFSESLKNLRIRSREPPFRN